MFTGTGLGQLFVQSKLAPISAGMGEWPAWTTGPVGNFYSAFIVSLTTGPVERSVGLVGLMFGRQAGSIPHIAS